MFKAGKFKHKLLAATFFAHLFRPAGRAFFLLVTIALVVGACLASIYGFWFLAVNSPRIYGWVCLGLILTLTGALLFGFLRRFFDANRRRPDFWLWLALKTLRFVLMAGLILFVAAFLIRGWYLLSFGLIIVLALVKIKWKTNPGNDY